MLALFAAACGGGGAKDPGSADKEQIKELMVQFFDALQHKDAAALAATFSSSCTNINDMAEAAAALVDRYGEGVTFQVNGVTVTGLTATTANALPQGTVTLKGQTAPLADETEPPTPLVKEATGWKIKDCDLFR